MWLEKNKLDLLRSRGLDIDGAPRHIPDDFRCEIPCIETDGSWSLCLYGSL